MTREQAIALARSGIDVVITAVPADLRAEALAIALESIPPSAKRELFTVMVRVQWNFFLEWIRGAVT